LLRNLTGDDGTGMFFRRKDVNSQSDLIAARWYKVSDTSLSTVLTNRFGTSISTVEHLMAALKLCNIDNLEVDGPEIPIMDGSARPFVEVIQSIGTRPTNTARKAIWIHKKIEVRDGDRITSLLMIWMSVPLCIYEQCIVGLLYWLVLLLV